MRRRRARRRICDECREGDRAVAPVCFVVEFGLLVARARAFFVIGRHVFDLGIVSRAVRCFRVRWRSRGTTDTLRFVGRRNARLGTQKRVTSEAGAGKALLRGLIRISLVTRVRTPNPPSVRVTDVSASMDVSPTRTAAAGARGKKYTVG